MCYSAQLMQDHREYLRQFPEAEIDIAEFAKLVRARNTSDPIKRSGSKKKEGSISLPKAMEHSFISSDRVEDAEIAELMRGYEDRRVSEIRAELAFQEARLGKAIASMRIKETKVARDSLRIAPNAISRLKLKLADAEREELLPRDSRIFAKGYAPVLVMIDGKLKILPMRYLLRPDGVDESWDKERSGCYNARRDSLTTVWRNQLGATHGVVMMQRFYENVWFHSFERRELRPDEQPANAIVEFCPDDDQTMFVACLWSHWRGAGDDLFSFAVITDEPPSEVSAVGHDRCPIQIRRDAVMDWLDTAGKSTKELLAVLDARARVTYEHRLVSTSAATAVGDEVPES